MEIFRVINVVLLCGVIQHTASTLNLQCNVVVTDQGSYEPCTNPADDFAMCLNPFLDEEDFMEIEENLKDPQAREEMYNTFNKANTNQL